jgi:hypothetical protein
MGCLPESGGCERQRTDPFVHHLNELEGKHFAHEICLDRVYRNSPQPEALYIDTATAEQLVIERKTLVWPRDYPARHKNDHLVADLLLKGLKELTSNAPYTIELEVGLVGQRDDLTAFAHHITTVIRESFHAVERGQLIDVAQVGRRWKFFREKPAWRDGDNVPETRLVVRWYPEETLDLASAPPEELLADIARLFASCIQKFQAYLHARRILLIDQHGDLQYLGDFWWERVFKALPPPSGIPEIWMGTHDWITDCEQDWIFEQLFPMSAPQEEDAV